MPSATEHKILSKLTLFSYLTKTGGAGILPPAGADNQKTYRSESNGGKKRVKGNRQGSLSRSITRRSGQNCKIKIQKIDFAILQAACQKSPKGLF